MRTYLYGSMYHDRITNLLSARRGVRALAAMISQNKTLKSIFLRNNTVYDPPQS